MGFRVAGAYFLSPLPGDFDSDNDVDGADFLQWQRGGDASQELAAWKNQYGTDLNLPAFIAVPEPGSLVLCGMAMVFLIHQTRQRKSRG